QAVARGSVADRAAHVGYHLIDQGRGDLEAAVAYRPPVAKRIRRVVVAHSTLAYLGPIAIITAVLVAGAAAYLRHEGGSTRAIVITLLLLMIPAADIEIALPPRVASW